MDKAKAMEESDTRSRITYTQSVVCSLGSAWSRGRNRRGQNAVDQGTVDIRDIENRHHWRSVVEGKPCIQTSISRLTLSSRPEASGDSVEASGSPLWD